MAKKVTTQIAELFLSGKTGRISNSYTDGSNLYLFDNLIAMRGVDGLYITNAGWKSNTTKERLNALPGVSINQKAGEWYLNGEKWDGKLTKIS